MKMSRRKFLERGAAAAVFASPILSAARELSSQSRIRVGLIGCGSVSGMYLPHRTRSALVEVVSVCDIIADRAKQRAAEFSITNYYSHIDEMLKGNTFDLFVNLTDMQEHG